MRVETHNMIHGVASTLVAGATAAVTGAIAVTLIPLTCFAPIGALPAALFCGALAIAGTTVATFAAIALNAGSHDHVKKFVAIAIGIGAGIFAGIGVAALIGASITLPAALALLAICSAAAVIAYVAVQLLLFAASLIKLPVSTNENVRFRAGLNQN